MGLRLLPGDQVGFARPVRVFVGDVREECVGVWWVVRRAAAAPTCFRWLHLPLGRELLRARSPRPPRPVIPL